MPIRTDNLRGLAPRMTKNVPLVDEPPIGHLQAVVLKMIDDLGSEAFGLNILEKLSLACGVWLDHSQIYTSIRRLLQRKPEPYIQLVATRPSEDGGPPVKLYKVTAAGRAALKTTLAHHLAVSEFLAARPKAARG